MTRPTRAGSGARLAVTKAIDTDREPTRVEWMALYAESGELVEALRAVVDAESLSPGDCYTDGRPNENWGVIDRAMTTARALLARVGRGEG